MRTKLDSISYFLSAEFLLRNRANSGSVVFFRSLVITLMVYVFVIALRSWSAEHSTLSFSFSQLKMEISETIPWLGAIFAGVYAALYTRFSSQWSYLASLYNQIMCIRATTKEEDINEEYFAQWEAAFLEDAIELHLASKPMFAPMVKQLIEDSNVKNVFLNSVWEGKTKLSNLEKQLGVSPSTSCA